MKKIFAAIIAFAFVFVLAACGETKPINAFDKFVSCVKSCDADGAAACVTESSSSDRYFSLIRSADADGAEVMKNLYSLISFTVLSSDVESDEAGGEIIVTDNNTRTIKVKVRYPDFSRLMMLASAERAVSGSNYTDILEEMYRNGTAEKYVLNGEFLVKIVKENGRWALPLDQSGVRGGVNIFESMMLTAFAAWLLG